jgi:hypothetical protein
MNTPELTPSDRGAVSVTAPVGLAIEHVKRMLFRPFDLGKWFVVGFCAWLALLTEGGGGGRMNFNFPLGERRGGQVDPAAEFAKAKEYVLANLNWIVPVAIVVLVLALAVGVLLLWLSSRGKFMFLHCVALNRAEVAAPWNHYGRQANSLFTVRLLLALAGTALALPLLAVVGWMAFRMFRANGVLGPELAWAILAGLGFFVACLVFGIIGKLLDDFVVPLMALRHLRCREACREFWGMLRARPGDFGLYLLFSVVLGIALGVITIVVLLCTCCFCLLAALPYIGTVILLPLFVFSRSYSLFYFAQFGPAFDVFAQLAPPAPTVPPPPPAA